MNFSRFPANSTNIFPIANSKTGGQLLTEFNLRSRESVMTDESIKYFVGPSYCHSIEDFYVRMQQDELGVVVSSTALEITPGRAVVNGHYIESLTSVVVDLAEANLQLKAEGLMPLEGKLAVGLRAMYSTEQTLAASMTPEGNNNLMNGIQVVILPIGNIAPGYFVLPEDSPDTDELVTAHIKLAEFQYRNGKINSLQQNLEKVQVISASRVGNFDDLLSSNYLPVNKLDPEKIYTLATKSEYVESPDGMTAQWTHKPTWCDSLDSLFVWQSVATKTQVEPSVKQAEFGVDASNQSVTLTIPHKNVDGMVNAAGVKSYYEPRVMELPKADFAKGTPGTVTSDYTKTIKEIKEFTNQLYTMPAGKQRGFVDILESDRSNLPTINQSSWRAGDYVLVREDSSVYTTTDSASQSPATMYVIVPPVVTDVELDQYIQGSSDIPAALDGTEVFTLSYSYPGGMTDSEEVVNQTLANLYENYESYIDIIGLDTKSIRGQYPSDTNEYSVYAWGVGVESANKILLEGNPSGYQDYIKIHIYDVPINTGSATSYTDRYYYYKVTKTESSGLAYSDPVILTGNIALATESSIGGFVNVSETDLDRGYIYRDSDGHLVLLDYALLRSGTLAYQLGQDYAFGEGLSSGTIQTELDEYVNERVAFPNAAQQSASVSEGRDPKLIKITLALSEESEESIINVRNIDSRWGTCVELILTGSANSNTIVNISNCQKLKLSLQFTSSESSPVITLSNVGLWYDASVIDYVHNCNSGNSGISGLSLWYEQFEDVDPDLVVTGMTVSEINTPVIPYDKDFWSEEVVNDNHFYYGLQSITLDPEGYLIGCGLYLRNETTSNISDGKSVVATPFTLPQGSSLAYPESGLKKQIKVTGQFVTGYPITNPDSYAIIDTKFTALTQYINDVTVPGTISFYIDAVQVDNVLYDDIEYGTKIDGWDSNSYHVFTGWVVG